MNNFPLPLGTISEIILNNDTKQLPNLAQTKHRFPSTGTLRSSSIILAVGCNPSQSQTLLLGFQSLIMSFIILIYVTKATFKGSKNYAASCFIVLYAELISFVISVASCFTYLHEADTLIHFMAFTAIISAWKVRGCFPSHSCSIDGKSYAILEECATLPFLQLSSSQEQANLWEFPPL